MQGIIISHFFLIKKNKLVNKEKGKKCKQGKRTFILNRHCLAQCCLVSDLLSVKNHSISHGNIESFMPTAKYNRVISGHI